MKITEQARIELKRALDDFDKPGAGIHIVSAQGCCGPSIQMGIATQIEKDETVISVQGIDFYVANEVLPILENISIAYGPNGFTMQGLARSGGCC